MAETAVARARGPDTAQDGRNRARRARGRASPRPPRARNLRLITAWRICKRSRLAAAFDGRGAAQNPGRWNGPGVAVVYTAESRSLASLEVLVHTEDTQVLAAIKWAMIPVRIDEPLIEIAEPIPDDWRQLPAPPSTRELGSRWVAEARSVVLRVPSIVVDGEFNYLLNPRHPAFAQLEIGEPQPFSFDPRLSTVRSA